MKNANYPTNDARERHRDAEREPTDHGRKHVAIKHAMSDLGERKEDLEEVEANI